MRTYLRADKTSNGLLGSTNGLVPAAAGAVRVVAGHTRGRGREARELGSGVRGWHVVSIRYTSARAKERGKHTIVLSLGLLLLGFALDLILRGTEDAADGRLDSASSRVDVRLEGGGVVVGRHG